MSRLPAAIDLMPMDEAQFCAYLAWGVPNYAAESIRAGNVPAGDALPAAEAVYACLLPQGRATPDNYLWAIVDAEQKIQVGDLWLRIDGEGADRYAALYELVIWKPFRRRGYGAAALEALEEKVRGLGLGQISLHVFGHNQAARAMYEKYGYRVTRDGGANLFMSRDLPAGG